MGVTHEGRFCQMGQSRQSFYIDASVTLRRISRFGRTAEELTDIGFSYPSIPVRVVKGPDRLEVGDAAEIRLEVEVKPDFGPGCVNKRESYWVEKDGQVNGLVTVKHVVPIGADPDAPSTWKDTRSQALETEASSGRIDCPACGLHFEVGDTWRWSGVRHRTCGQKLKLLGVEDQVQPVWCLVGNIVEERPFGHGGEETRRGTKHFSPGTKVYCFPPLWGDGYERVKVIGKHRGSRRMATMIIRSDWITNRRAKLVYQPSLVDQLSGYWDGTEKSKELAETLAGTLHKRLADEMAPLDREDLGTVPRMSLLDWVRWMVGGRKP